MLALAAFAASVALAPDRQAQAVVRIERPARMGREEWERPSQEQRREILVRHGTDGLVRIRLTEFE